ncbi:MAG: excinuclease ABC subunit UvrC [Clostridiales bacterium]|nr:excinuclease ABC subunit UvrC [Clostridiales bacterium]
MARIPDERIKRLRSKAMRLPLTPGVYIMKNRDGEIIYIGKAKALKNRVSQYFGSDANHGAKVRAMVANVEDFDYILVGSEFEALVLECSLIKQHMPKYNILLKDDKGFSYIRVSPGEWRKISAVFQKEDDGAEYIGPYTSSFFVRQAVEEANEIFKLPTCSRVFPRDIGKARPCLDYFIKKCSAPCAGKISHEEYKENVASALEFIRGGSDGLVKKLRAEMEECSENLEFERAAKLRDRIRGIEKVGEKQRVFSQKYPRQDVFAVARSSTGKCCLDVMRFADGRLFDNEYFFFDGADEGTDMSELVVSFYEIRTPVPPRVSICGEVDDAESLSRLLSEKADRRVEVAVPRRGDQEEIARLALANANEKLMQKLNRATREKSAVDELGVLLGLKAPPEYIEAYDISHLAGQDVVAGMVVFREGRPSKKNYRKFSIKSFEGQDDYRALAETISRRLAEYEKHKDDGSDEGFGRLPDLILLDGGRGQVSAVMPVIEQSGLSIPVFGMVKDGRHRTRAIATDGAEIQLTEKRAAFTLVTSMQDEAHRFANVYRTQKHNASAYSLKLTEIPGIGEAKARAVIKHFGTLKALRGATVEQIAQAPGIGDNFAGRIYDWLHGDEG